VPLPACAKVPVIPPGDDVAVYPVIVEPPSEAGAVKGTDACAFPATAVPIVGAPGTVTGVAELEAELAVPVPTAFVAVTVKVYAVPLVSPVTVIVPLPACAKVPVIPSGDEVAVYPVIVEPPSLAGAVYVTVACAFPPVAVPIVGASGTVEGVTELEAELAVLVPIAFVAITVKV
jgi:hypothetical protein